MTLRLALSIILVIATASMAWATSTPSPEEIYERIAVIERIPPAQRTGAHYVQLGRDYRNTGRVDDALVQAKAAIVLRPDDGDALLLLGDLQFQRAEYSQALATFDRVVQLRPGQAIVQLRRSQALSAMGKSREAEAANALYVTLRHRHPTSTQP